MADPQDHDDALDDALDLALDGAFAAARDVAAPTAGQSVLQAMQARIGARPSVSLREVDSAGGTPILRPLTAGDGIARETGRYMVQGLLGLGGVGAVHKGHDVDLGRDVALKFLHEEYKDEPAMLHRFVEEAQIGGQLQHPGIVPVYELGMAEGRPFFAMKIVKGQTLAKRLAVRSTRADDRRTLLSIFEAVCQTMAYAHSRGVIHRDLKPANVMVGAFGEVQVVDWGMAKVLPQGGVADEEALRRSRANISVIETIRSRPRSGPRSVVGSVMGTPAYMPPEQATGDVDRMDERSDVFSLGAVLCEILTGLPPYTGDSEEVLSRSASCDTDEAHRRLDACGADRELAALCRECLRPAPTSRPRDAQVLAERIGAYLHSVEERAQNARLEAAEANGRAEAERKSRRLTVGLAASVLLTVGVAGGAWSLHERAAGERRAATEQKVLAALVDVDSARTRGLWPQAVALVRQARSLLTEDVGESLRRRVAQEAASIEGAAADARAAAELSRRNDALLLALADVRLPHGDRIYPDDWRTIAEAHRRVFLADGLDLLAESEAQAVAALAARGIPVRLAVHVDLWSQAARRAEDPATAERLTRIASLADEDPVREQLRAAIHGEGAAELKALAEREDLAAWPPQSIALLGGALFHDGSLASATEVYRTGVRQHPTDAALNAGLGAVLARRRDYQSAARVLQVARVLRPDSVEVVHQLGAALEGLGTTTALRDALSLFSDAVETRPEDGHLWFHVGVCHSLLGQHREAIAPYREAIERDPGFRASHTNLARHLDLLERDDECLEVVAAGLRRFPHDPELHQRKLAVLGRLGRYEELEAEYRKLAEDHPDHRVYRSVLAEALRGRGQLEEAVALFRELVAEDESDHRSRGRLGRTLRDSGRRDEAVDALRKALESADRAGDAARVSAWAQELAQLGHGSEMFHWLRAAAGRYRNSGDVHAITGSVCMKNGRFELAVEHFTQAHRLDPHREAYWLHARCLCELGRPEEAAVIARRGIAIRGETFELLSVLGRALALAEEWDESLEAWRGALRSRPDDLGILQEIAGIFDRTGDLREMELTARRMAAIDESHPSTQLVLGVVSYRQGHLEEAAASYRRVIEARPAWPVAYEALCHILHEQGEHDAARELRLTGVVAGLEPRDAREAADAIWVAHRQGRFLDAVRLLHEAAEMDPTVLADAGRFYRYNAACAACLAAAGRGDGEDLTEDQRRSLRAEAVQWLQEELRRWAEHAKKDAGAARSHLEHWLNDGDLACIRDDAWLQEHSGVERRRCAALWKQVAELVRTLASPAK